MRRKDKLKIVRNFQIAKSNASFPGGNSEWEPPDPFPNSEVKTLSADGSVGSPHVRVGHRQDLNQEGPFPKRERLFFRLAVRIYRASQSLPKGSRRIFISALVGNAGHAGAFFVVAPTGVLPNE